MTPPATIGGPKVRRPVALALSIALWVGLGVGGTLLYVTHRGSAAPKGPASVAASPGFSHVYPPDPVPFERPAVALTSPVVPASQRLHRGLTIHSLTALARATPTGTVAAEGSGTWRLTRPVELPATTSLSLRGPLRLELAPGAFLIAEHGAAIRLQQLTVVGVDRAGRPQAHPTPGRGFITARSGAVLQLRADRLIDLGHLGDQTYGVTADGASSAFLVAGCTIRGSFFGVYLARLSGGTVSGNHVLDSVIYGIDPHTSDSHLRIVDNVVTGSGVHGIVLADQVTNSVVSGNVVTRSRDHGIVIITSSNDNVIRGNTVAATFDGIVVKDSSGNQIVGNSVGPVARFGIRISGASTGNQVLHNVVHHALLGMYLYDGATGNAVTANRFAANYENVRVRRDAPGNTVTPTPPRSEL